MARKYIDCRESPSDTNCTLSISGTEDEVLDLAVTHAVSAHGHKDTHDLRAQLRSMLKDAPEAKTATG
jgi:Protein of unknown function (DUF1059)